MQVKGWASYQIAGIAKDVANKEIAALVDDMIKDYVDDNVNIKYELVSNIPTWTIGEAITVKEYTTYSVLSGKQLNISNKIRFNSDIYDASGNAGSVKKIYKHTIAMGKNDGTASNNYYLIMEIENNTSIPFDISALKDYINELNGLTLAMQGNYRGAPCFAVTKGTQNATVNLIVYDATLIYTVIADRGLNDYTTFTDSVVAVN